MTENRRTTVSELAMKLADRKSAGASSVTMKLNAKGEFVPEVVIVAGEEQATVDAMVVQAVGAYAKLLEAGKAEA